MDITIDFEDQKGLVDTGGLGTYEISVGQYRVWAINATTGQRMHVGYMCKGDDSPFNGTLQMGELPAELQEKIVTAVREKVQRDVRVAIPPNYRAIEAAEQEMDDDDDDDSES